MHILKPQEEIECNNTKYRVLEFLGSGGQGEVYKVCDKANNTYALKWYYPHTATEAQQKIIFDLIRAGKPSAVFLWPLALGTSRDKKTFGYLMDLRPPEYKNINDLMMGSIDPTYQVLIRTCIELCKGMRALHNKGLCYRDISFGNAFFDSLTGDILICDNDNVTQNNSANGSILGTPDFMAPEIVRREKEPSNHTDLHSLAVLLFYMLFMGHPLSGRTILSIRCWDRAAREQLYGKEPLFIFHPTNRKNEAVDLAHDPTGEAGGFAIKYWNKYPERFKSKVSKAFTDGIVNPNGRVTELEWIAELVHLHDSIVKCSCGKVNFLTAIPGQKCGYCDKLLPNRPTLKIGSTSVVLDRTTKIYQHHLGKKYEFTQPTGEVVQNPQNPQIWGLRNKTNTNWYATTSSGQQVEILPNRSIPIVKGTKVKFGNNIDGIFE